MTRLKNILLLNAVSSGVTGLLLIILPGFIAGLFGVPQSAPFIFTGIFLVIFASWVYLQSRNEPLQTGRIKGIIATDILWVIASLIIILPRLFDLSGLGYFLIGAVALWVTAMAILQNHGLKKLSG